MKVRRKSRKIFIGDVPVGGDAPVTVQSMTNTDTRDAEATLCQIRKLHIVGCEIIRLAVPDETAAEVLADIVRQSPIPVIADIHFDHRLALKSIAAGASAIRINPGNIGGDEKVRAVAEKAGEAGIPIRVGSNTGSLPEGLYEKIISSGKNHADSLAAALVESASAQCALLEKYGFRDIKVSLKSSDVPVTIEAYRRFAEISDYPLHIGITEAGTLRRGIVKSALGIGALLMDGIGDTLRVSLTADPVEEIIAGVMILECAGLRQAMPEIVSCPTCGRTEINLIELTDKVEKLVAEIKSKKGILKLKKIAIMGCVVNGPGEAKDADLGICGGKSKIIIFKKGLIIGTYPENEGFERFREELINSEK
ncbi:MAG: 4-hydroxy-3-methylbut-2-en-1-yl diphosphate synthase [Lentisphaerae bacterium GWF2_45_14]|nr:MAG: 4-hydroxy-3-methylbut-2-en-1-yl diphosphate synthase [Lentisphaerae bacterium GWF2_45_14]